MASEKDLELLDQYLGSRLNAQDKAAFERQLETDVDLKNEFRFQQKVIDSVRKARVTELKKMLNDIPVYSIPSEGTSLLSKVGLFVLGTALVGTALYFYLNQEDKSITQPSGTETVTAREPAITEAVTGEEPSKEELVESKPDEPRETKTTKTPAKSPVVEKSKEEPVAPSPLDVFDPTEESAKTDGVDSNVNSAQESKAPSIIVETLTDKKYTFHYQFKDDKLFLYGAFEKNLYEIMEFFSDNKRTMFLFYKENYYLLDEEDERVRALAPIKDTTLLQKLKDYRKN
jgi:hypothetical protein